MHIVLLDRRNRMTDDTMKDIICFLKTNGETDMKEIWVHLSKAGAFQTSASDTIKLCKILVKEELFEYPLWLQNDVIRLIIDESDINIKKEIKIKLQSDGVFCLALTEQFGGSSFQNVKTQVSDNSVGNKKAVGKKVYISNGNIADNIIFLARDSDEKLNLFYTDDLNNMVRGKLVLSDAMGRYDLAEIEFVNTKCQCLYTNNALKAMFVLNKAMAVERLFCSITMLVMTKSLLEVFLRVYREKRDMLQGSQYWKFSYAKMKLNTHLLETYLSNLEEMYVEGKAILPSDVAIAKSYATDTLKYILEKTEILLGAQSILKSNILIPYEAYSKAYYSAGGTNEIMKEIIGADL